MKKANGVALIGLHLSNVGLLVILEQIVKVMAYSPPFVKRRPIRGTLSLQRFDEEHLDKSPNVMLIDVHGAVTNTETPSRFDPTHYKAYTEAMEQVITSFRIKQKRDTIEDFEAAKRFLFSSEILVSILPTIDLCISRSSSPLSQNINSNSLSPQHNELPPFGDVLREQKDLFMKETKFTQEQRQISQRALSYMGDYCAKTRTSLPLYVAWEKIKEAGICPRDHTLSTYLYSLTSMDVEFAIDEDRSGNTSVSLVKKFSNGDNVTASHDPSDVSEQVAIYHDLLYKPTENTASIRIKKLVDQGRAKEAGEILSKLSALAEKEIANAGERKQRSSKKGKKNDALLKLRTFLPVLNAYCEQDNASSALRMYESMKKEPSVYLDDKTYSLLISSLAKMGYFRSDSPDIEGMDKLQFSSACGPRLFDEIASEMANDVLEIDSDCVREMRNALVTGFAGSNAIGNLSEVPYDCTLAPVEFMAADDELVACRVTIKQNDILCPRTNAKLRLILLEQDQKCHVHDTLLQMADTQFEAHENMLNQKQMQNNNGNTAFKPSMQEENFARKHLESFAEWLDTREGKPFTAIVDGANVAYYGLGNVNYHHIDLMVKTLENMGETPLVIIPQKYTQKKFYLRQGYVQELHPSQVDILKDLEEKQIIYKVPSRCLDDYYWMLSSVSKQSVSSNTTNLDVPPNNEQGRWPGTRPMLITNDQMRDHKLELLEPRLFRRWSSSYIVNYDFPPLHSDRSSDKEITFQPADFFSREIQGNPSNRKNDSTSWHFPVNEWDRNDRFCIRIPKI